MFENLRRGRQARNLTINVPKILDLQSSSEQIFSENWRWVPLLSVQLSSSQSVNVNDGKKSVKSLLLLRAHRWAEHKSLGLLRLFGSRVAISPLQSGFMFVWIMFSKYVQRCHHKLISNRNTNCAKFGTLKRAQRAYDCKLVNKDPNHKNWWLEDSFVVHYPTNINWPKKGFVISKICMSVYRFSGDILQFVTASVLTYLQSWWCGKQWEARHQADALVSRV